jgi:copper chaperone NosL
MRARLATWALGLFFVFACSVEAQTARCEHCGMRVDPAGAFTAGATQEGRALAFDSNKCLLRYRLDHASITGAWVTDYYARTHVALAAAFFVTGSDVSGPMGADLVALGSRADAERFLHDHHGSAIYASADVTSALVRSFFP